MKNRKYLKNILYWLSTGWLFLLVLIGLQSFFPEIFQIVGPYLFIVAIITLFISGISALGILTNDDYWRSLEDMTEEYYRWAKESRKAIARKRVYDRLIATEFGIPKEKFADLVDKEIKKLIKEKY